MSDWRSYLTGEERIEVETLEHASLNVKEELRLVSSRIERLRNRCILRQRRDKVEQLDTNTRNSGKEVDHG